MNQPSQTPSIIQFHTWKLIAWAAGAVLVVLGLLAAVMLWLEVQVKRSEFTPVETVRQIIIGNDVLDIPENYIRFSRQRQQSVLEQAEIVLLMPDGAGYSADKQDQFRNTAGDNNLIFVSLLKRKMAEDMSARLNTIYESLFSGVSQSGPAGLTLQSFKPGVGYNNDVLAIHYGEDFTWVARCQSDVENITPACLRDINIGESLSARYRFPVAHLSQWREIETLVRKKISQFLLK